MSTSLLTQEMRRTYAAQRGVSRGAHITLAAVSGGFCARYECAEKCAEVLDNRQFSTAGFPTFFIPMEVAHKSITKLAETFSVALVDTVTDEQGSRFVLVWKIVPRGLPVAEITEADALALVDANQGTTDELDEY